MEQNIDTQGVGDDLGAALALLAYGNICRLLGQEPNELIVRQGESWPDGPVLCRDWEGWYSTTAWAVVWEGDYDWTVEASFAPGAATDGVFLEPVNGFVLGLYAADVEA